MPLQALKPIAYWGHLQESEHQQVCQEGCVRHQLSSAHQLCYMALQQAWLDLKRLPMCIVYTDCSWCVQKIRAAVITQLPCCLLAYAWPHESGHRALYLHRLQDLQDEQQVLPEVLAGDNVDVLLHSPHMGVRACQHDEQIL